MSKPVYGLKTDIRSGEPGGNNIMIDGIVNTTAGSIDELRELLKPVHTVVDLTNDEPAIAVRHGSTDSLGMTVESVPPGTNQ